MHHQLSVVHQLKNRLPFMDAALNVSLDGTELFIGQVDYSERDFMIIENFGDIQK